MMWSGRHPRVVIVGAGFGGMQTAQSLARSGAEICLIDRNTYNTFVPLLYQVAAAQLEPESIAYPIRTILRRSPRTRFLQAEVKAIDLIQQVVETDTTTIPYDYLVLATGSQTRYLGVSGAIEYGFPLRTLSEAVLLRNHLFQCFEQAAQESDPQRLQRLLTFVIVGGGATGLEMAGTLVELKRALRWDYPGVDLNQMQIVLVHSNARLLPELPGPLGRYALRKLQRMGVEIRLETRVRRVNPKAVEFQEGESLATDTVIWVAGQAAAIPLTSPNLQTADKQKLITRATLQLQTYDTVYALGDLAYVKRKRRSLRGVAPEALQGGVAVARNITRQIRGQDPLPFHYFNKGRLAIIGAYGGVGKIGPLLLTGFIPWFLWLSVHLVYLPGFRNRAVVLLNWLHAYGRRDRAIRLILSYDPGASRYPQRLP